MTLADLKKINVKVKKYIKSKCVAQKSYAYLNNMKNKSNMCFNAITYYLPGKKRIQYFSLGLHFVVFVWNKRLVYFSTICACMVVASRIVVVKFKCHVWVAVWLLCTWMRLSCTTTLCLCKKGTKHSFITFCNYKTSNQFRGFNKILEYCWTFWLYLYFCLSSIEFSSI